MDFPRAECLHSLFEAQAARTPTQAALVHEDVSLTYQELNRLADRLARRLRSLGVGPEVRVGLCAERSIEMVVGVLAVLKAGGAYVPLDARYPRERLEYMLRDSQAQVLLAHRALLPSLPAHPSVVLLDGLGTAEALDLASVEEPVSGGATGDNLAYVIYTSGSTGRPKGVTLGHAALCNLMRWHLAQPALALSARTLQFASLSFDVSCQEMFSTWASGGTLVLISEEDRRDSTELLRVLETARVERLFLPFVALHHLAEQAVEVGRAPSALREIITAGEQLQVTRPLTWLFRQLPGCSLHNHYGPSESHVVTAYTLEGPAESWPALPPIGRAIANSRTYVLDERLEPVPVGTVGELYLGGACLARGYWNRPELTAERFIPDPFSREPGERMYRTGDLARALEDGNIEFLGRADHQVKIRGFRIELGEVEVALRQHAEVREAVVVAREDSPGVKRLVAYVTGEKGVKPSPEALRTHLQQRLPEFMVPSAVVVLEALPLSPNGKVDRKALPEPGPVQREAEVSAPRTPVEQVVASVFGQLLGVGEVGREDHFFELGGHSLLATQVVSRLRKALGVEVKVSALFSAPTVAGFAREVERARRVEGEVELKAVGRGAREGALSFAQQRLWFLQKLEPGNPFYNIPCVLVLEGRVEEASLERALVAVVQRHEGLRTRFGEEEGRAFQKVEEQGRVKLEVEGWEGRTWAEVEERAKQEARKPFELEEGPLVRAVLLRLSGEKRVLLLTVHHIVADGWSLEVMLREVGQMYAASERGEQGALPELPVQYVDYAQWQRQWLKGRVQEEQLAYWRKQLAGVPGALELPTDKPRPAVRRYRGARHEVELPGEVVKAVREVARQEGATPFMVLVGALQVLLHRYTGQEDIVVGTPVANRGQVEVEGVVGFFANTLAVRTRLEGQPSFREVLGRVRESALGAYGHQDVPFERLVEELQPARDLSRTPFFQVMLAVQDAAVWRLQLPGVQVRQVEVDPGISKFDLTLFLLEEADGGLRGFWEYDTDLFEAGTVQRLAGHYERVLGEACRRPEEKVWRLPLLGAEERRQLVEEWNDTRVERPEGCIHRLFEEQAQRTPEAVALSSEEQRLTYAQLNARANQLAHRLQGLGVGPDVLVGVCMERSLEMVVALLGVLKAGGAYLPLDPGYPAERLQFMLEDARTPVLLTQAHLTERLPTSGTQVVVLEAAGSLGGGPEDNLPLAVESSNLAYVTYTSGSTGRPKGVCIPHRGVVRLVRDGRYARMAADEVFLQFAPISFDATTFEIWGCLLHGGRLAIFPPGRASIEELARYIETQGVTTLWLTAGLFHQMVDGPIEHLRHVRQLLAGGDVLSVAHAEKLRERLPGCQLINGYGPTESTTFTACHPVPAQGELGTSVSIGRPIAETQVYLLDAHLQPVPVGVVGELYIGGKGLARGYWNRPELTAERFIPDPFSREPGERLYRTGDLARYLESGNIEFLGRADHQVKIRGYRIELGEVEAALTQHPEVREAVAVVRGDGAGGKRLVAYVTAKGDARPAARQLQESLRGKLPEFMVPSAVVVLEALPLSPNGKVDRKALPEPGTGEREGGVSPPRTPVEQVVASVFGQLLGVGEVGREDHFFELGGHSLLATQVVSRLRKVLGVEVKLSALFSAPTVAGFAREVERARRVEGEVELKAMGRGAREEALSFAQQRLWFLQKLEPGNPFYNIPCVLVLEGRVEEASLERALVEVVQRHEGLRTRFGEEEGRAFQKVEEQGRVKLEVEGWEGRTWAEVEERAKQEARKPFELEEGPLVRAVLLRLGAEKRVLLLTVHHIVADGWSLEVVLREVGQMYAASERGEQGELPELPVQYVDYAQWQRQWLKGRVQEEQLAYWRKRLAGVPGALELPTDKPRPAVRRYRGARHEVALPGEVVKAVREVARQEGATPFMVLVGALQVLLHRYTGQEDIVVGTPVANRGQVEVEGVVGFFANTLAVRTRLEGQPSFREVLGRVRESALGAYGHQDVPFEKLVEELQPARDLSRTPFFQVMLAVQDAAVWRLQLPGVQVRQVEVDPGISKFDLTLFLLEEADGGLRGFWEYDTDLFEAGTVQRLAGHYERVLGEACRRSEEKVWRLPLLGAEERRQLVEEWNDTRVERPEGCIHRLFEEQAQRTPEAVALSSEEQRLTYAQLNARANQLAHRLQGLGVGPDVLVGVCMERSLEMVVALLGVLKAGGAYLPLDPGYPAERLQFMLEDARTPVLLTQKQLKERVPSTGTKVVVLDEAGALDGWPESNPPLTVSGGNLAYVIYTSGSTGRPKGACVPHRGIWNRLLWMQEAYRLTGEDRILQKTPFGFDVSVWEFFWPLMYGARLVMARPGGHQDAAYLIDCIVREGITTLHFVPSMLEAFLEQPGVERCQSIRRVICSGEALPAELQRRFFSRMGAELHNLYGPTEASVDVSFWACSRMDSRNLVPIGWPIHNIRLHVLDPHLQPVPQGVVGELYIGGVGLARGYLNRPELTAERFIPDPFGTEPGGRLYRTGDLARYLPDASIDFLGRADHQVKIRGFRIELGEIEVALRQHSEVREAVVVAREDAPGAKRLVAYVTGEKGAKPSLDALRSHLKQRLPEHMVPSVTVVLEALPLSPNGKVDRKALPAPALALAEPSLDTGPLSPVEELLAGIWRQVLNLPRVGREDDFFALGGDSILSLRIVARANAAGLAINVKQLFQNPTVAGLAAQVAAMPSGPGAVATPQAVPMAGLNDKSVRAVLSRFRARDGEAK